MTHCTRRSASWTGLHGAPFPAPTVRLYDVRRAVIRDWSLDPLALVLELLAEEKGLALGAFPRVVEVRQEDVV